MRNKKEYCYKYPRPAYTADCIVFTEKSEYAEVVLIKRGFEPFKNYWAFPGGFVDIDETAYNAAKRELFEETGLKTESLSEYGIFDALGRDPRGRTVTVVYCTFNKEAASNIVAGDDAAEVKLFSIKDLPKLAFDHKEILQKAVKELIYDT
ncbi:MAG: NUDIX hydrolase [Bacteroidales bacterium]|nr:NUDIX hydrolase [Bacteroidales bacterium]